MSSKHQVVVIVVGVLTVGALEAIALVAGVDGALFMIAVAAIGGLVGWKGKTLYDKRKSG